MTIEVLIRALFALQGAHQDDGVYDIIKIFTYSSTTRSKITRTDMFFSFCDYRIATGVFKSITVSFLPVGHTHKDADRRFSYISHYLKNHNISLCTLEDLHEALQKSQQSTNVHFYRIKALYNFSGALLEQ